MARREVPFGEEQADRGVELLALCEVGVRVRLRLRLRLRVRRVRVRVRVRVRG